MVRHTPGPWATRDTHDNGTEISADAMDGLVIATVYPRASWFTGSAEGTDPVQEANANLIAAAPAILDEARSAAQWLKVLVPYLREIAEDSPSYSPLLTDTERQAASLESAVRKAEGTAK